MTKETVINYTKMPAADDDGFAFKEDVVTPFQLHGHGLFYVQRDGSRMVRLDADPEASLEGFSEAELMVLRALLELANRRVSRAMAV